MRRKNLFKNLQSIRNNQPHNETLTPPLIKESCLDWNLHVLKNQIKLLKQEINSSRKIQDDFGDSFSLWIDSFEKALKIFDSEPSLLLLKELEEKFIGCLQSLLEDPISGELLNEDAVLGNDGYTYNKSSLERYFANAPETQKTRSPLNPENPTAFTTVDQPLVRIALDYLISKGISFPCLNEKSKVRLFLTKSPKSIPHPSSDNPQFNASRDIGKNFTLEQRIEHLKSLQKVETRADVTDGLQVNVVRRRLFAELATIEHILNSTPLADDRVTQTLKNWITEFRKKIQEAPFSSSEETLEILRDELNALFTQMASLKTTRAPRAAVPGALLVDVLGRQSYAALTAIEKKLEENPYLEDKLTLSIRNWTVLFREELKNREPLPNGLFLQELVQKFTSRLQKVLQDSEALAEASPILQSVIAYLEKKHTHYSKALDPTKKASTQAEKIERMKARHEKRVKAEAAKIQSVAKQMEKIEPVIEHLVAAQVDQYSKTYIDSRNLYMQKSTDIAIEEATAISKEDQKNFDSLEESLGSLEQEIQTLLSRNREIDTEIENLGNRITQTEYEELQLEKSVNELIAATIELKKRKKQSIWNAVVSIGGCMLASYGLSYLSGMATAVVPAGQGTGAAIHVRLSL